MKNVCNSVDTIDRMYSGRTIRQDLNFVNMKEQTIGLPVEVAMYHPIEFLELKKMTVAFLNQTFEKQKGGIAHQLIVGHVVSLMGQYGTDILTAAPRFKQDYLDDLLTQFRKKSIDPDNLGQYVNTLDTNKARQLTDPETPYQSEDRFDRAANIYCSSNYSMFNFLEFNRKVSSRHVRTLVESIRSNGILSYPMMIYTNCIDGIWRYWIIDGQHRFEAFRKLGFPIRFTLYQKLGAGEITLRDIVRLIAQVNSTSRKWGLNDYLRAWMSIGVSEYIFLKNKQSETKLALNTLLQAYSGLNRTKATNLFMAGTYSIKDTDIGNMHVSYLQSLKDYVPKGTASHSALLDLFRTIPEYNNMIMKNRLAEMHGSHSFQENQEDILKEFLQIYVDAA